jgi:hypothetical protein
MLRQFLYLRIICGYIVEEEQIKNINFFSTNIWVVDDRNNYKICIYGSAVGAPESLVYKEENHCTFCAPPPQVLLANSRV